MANCPKCGSPVKPGQKFCTKCGQKLDVVQQAPQQTQQAEGQKGFIDNVTHLGTFMRQGSQGVDRQVRREQQERVARQAEEAGLQVQTPREARQQQQALANAQAQAQQGQPQQRRLVVDTDSVEGVDIVSGRAIWNIQQGEIARRVTEREFAAADSLKGVIVQEGCTAMVFIDGQMVSMLSAGAYTFPAKTETERKIEQQQKELDDQQKAIEKREKELQAEEDRKAKEYSQTFAARGVFGELAAAGRGVMNFLFGKKKDEKPAQRQQRLARTEQKLKAIPAPKICRVYLVSNRIIDLIFGSQINADGYTDFAPLNIPSKLVDLNIGVSMQLQINNMQTFVANYLADRDRVTVLHIQQLLMPAVKATLTQLLRNLDYQATGLPEPIVNNLKGKLQATCNECLQGIEVIKVLDITDSSADFERFRAVEREIFASDKELDFLQRTGEIKNRLEQEQNKQLVNGARNQEELRQAMQSVNKDKLLSEDEMEQFVLLLESQKRIREAEVMKDETIAKEKVRQALVDMKKSGLVKDDELAALENTLEQGKIDRENVTEIMRVQAMQKVDMARQIAEFELSDNEEEHRMARALRQAQHNGDLTAAQIDARRIADAYDDERNEFDWKREFSRRQQEDDYMFSQNVRRDDYDWKKTQRERDAANQQAMFQQQLDEQRAQAEHARSRQDKFDDMDILDRKAQIAARNMQAMKEAELRAQQEQHAHEQNIHAMDTNVALNRDNVEAQMSAEQLMAKNIGQMGDAGQTAFAQSLGSGKEAELRAQQAAEQKALYEQMMANQNSQNMQNQQMMMQMAQMMQQGMMGVAGQQMANQQAMFNQQQQFQQQRYNDQVAMKNEYRDNMQHQQARMDHTQDTAMGQMGQVSGAAASNINAYSGGYQPQATQSQYQQAPQQPAYQQPQQAAYQQPQQAAYQQPQQAAYQQPQQPAYQQPEQPQGCICPNCGAPCDLSEGFCMECGTKL